MRRSVGYPLRLKRESWTKRVIDFLQKIGTGVVGYRSKKITLEGKSAEMMSEFQTIINKYLQGEDHVLQKSSESYKLELAHESDEADPVYLSLDMESHGTRRLLIVLNSVFRAIDRGTLLIIDELDASLHTQIGDAILSLFSDPKDKSFRSATSNDDPRHKSYGITTSATRPNLVRGKRSSGSNSFVSSVRYTHAEHRQHRKRLFARTIRGHSVRGGSLSALMRADS